MDGKFVYHATSGTWFLISKDENGEDNTATVFAHGWAGNHAGKNNPDMDNIPCVGPLPIGGYTGGSCDENGVFVEGRWEDHHDHLGNMVMFWKPDATNEMHGRGDFFCHGPAQDPAKYGQESRGCTVVPHDDRQKIKDSGVYRLEVVR